MRDPKYGPRRAENINITNRKEWPQIISNISVVSEKNYN